MRRAALAVAAALVAAAPAGAAPAPIETIAGNGVYAAFTPPGANTLATEVSMRGAAGLGAIPTGFLDGGVAFATPTDHRVLQVDSDGNIRHRAGTGTAGTTGDGAAATSAQLNGPRSVGWRSALVELLIADTINGCIRTINHGLPGEVISRHAGVCNPAAPPSIQEDPAKRLGAGGEQAVFYQPRDVEPFLDGNSYWVANGYLVRQVVGDDVTTAAGRSFPLDAPTEGGSPTGGYLTEVMDIGVGTTAGTFFIAATGDIGGPSAREVDHVYKVSAGTIRTAAGGGASTAEDVSATTAKLESPTSVVGLADDGFLVYDAGHAKIRRVTSGTPGTIRTIVGTGVAGESPDGTPADQAQIRSTGRMAVTTAGLVFSQGETGRAIRRVPATAILSGPSGITQSKSAAFTLGSWDDEATFECKLDAGIFGACGSLSNLSDGQHTFTARATTNDGTMEDIPGAVRTWTVDSTAPAEFALVSPAAGAAEVPPLPTFTWEASSDANGVARYELWIDGQKSRDAGTATSAEPAAPLSEGQHTWQVKAFDSAGNERASETRTLLSGSAPTAALTVSPNPALTGGTVTFDASASADSSGPIAQYEWDLDGDGAFELATPGGQPTTSRSYGAPGAFAVSVRVSDAAGLTAVASQELRINAPTAPSGQFGVTINRGAQYTRTPAVTVTATFPAATTGVLVSNDGGFLLPQTFGPQRDIEWRLDSSGPERLPKIVYVRFLSGPFVSETHTDDIILDETPPRVLSAALSGAAASSSAALAAKARTLRIRARDNVSGVASMQVTKSKRRPGRVRRFKRRVAVAARGPVFVRVRDKAKNWSRWRKAR